MGKDSHVTSADEQRMLRLSGYCANVTLLINVVSAAPFYIYIR